MLCVEHYRLFRQPTLMGNWEHLIDKQRLGERSQVDRNRAKLSCRSEGKNNRGRPREVQNYVAAHEVCHLIEMNHSPNYWKLVESVVPTYKTDRSWLKLNGNLLHQYKL